MSKDSDKMITTGDRGMFNKRVLPALFRLVSLIDEKSKKSEDWNTIIYHLIPFLISVAITIVLLRPITRMLLSGGDSVFVILLFGLAFHLAALGVIRCLIQFFLLTSLQFIRNMYWLSANRTIGS